MLNDIFLVFGSMFLVVVGSILGYYARQTIARGQLGSIEQKITKATAEAETKAREIIIAAKDKAEKALEAVKLEEKEGLKKLDELEDRLVKRQENLDRRIESYEAKEGDLQEKIEKVKQIKSEIEALRERERETLEKIAGFTLEQAKENLLKTVEEKYRQDILDSTVRLEKLRGEELERKALELMVTAIHRYSRSHVSDVMTSMVSLPNEDLKGKIIGREGRNIRTLERLTGVEIIVDETPDAITISGYDPIRREVAKTALEKLIQDGRIQPAKIEEKVAEAQKEIQERIKKAGEAAAYETGILDLPKEIVHLIGRLAFRTSFGQNVLLHSIEAAHISGILAKELGLNVEVAKKGALLHDIGKAVDHEIEGTHVEIGRKILKKYGIREEIIRAMEAHHEEYPFSTPESFIVTAAEAVSAARPGARRDTVENYLKRLENLEKIANSFPGIEKTYAIQAGREIRIFVTPTVIDDLGAIKLAKDVADKIEQELKYPGEIKVNVIRETRAVEYAR